MGGVGHLWRYAVYDSKTWQHEGRCFVACLERDSVSMSLRARD
jgi:hypothetical protein